MRDLTLVISDKPDLERDAVAAAWEVAGGEVVRLGRFWDPPSTLDRTRARVYGADTFCQVLAQKLALALVSPPDDLLLQLPAHVLDRAVAGIALADGAALAWPRFVKSMIPKLVRAQVYESHDQLLAATTGLPGDTVLFASDVIELHAEARAWTLAGDVTTIALYEGAGAALDDARTLARELAAYTPSPCVIDVGLTARGWLVIEVNAAWGAGLNGCDAAAAARCIAYASSAAP